MGLKITGKSTHFFRFGFLPQICSLHLVGAMQVAIYFKMVSVMLF